MGTGFWCINARGGIVAADGNTSDIFGLTNDKLIAHWDHLLTSESMDAARLSLAVAVYLRDYAAGESVVYTASGLVLVRWAMEPIYERGLFAGFGGLTRPLQQITRGVASIRELPFFFR